MPLHCACQEGHVEVAEIMVENGASVDSKEKVRTQKSFCFCHTRVLEVL